MEKAKRRSEAGDLAKSRGKHQVSETARVPEAFSLVRAFGRLESPRRRRRETGLRP